LLALLIKLAGYTIECGHRVWA